jgi:alkylhydroperoxidase family enzyme
MELGTVPGQLACSACGEAITDAGYLPATEREAGYEPLADDAVCDGCGFNDLGMMGCAPELDDVVEPDSADVLLYVRRTDDALEVVSAKE